MGAASSSETSRPTASQPEGRRAGGAMLDACGWRSLDPTLGLEASPPIPAAWLRRLAPAAAPPADDDVSGGEAADWEADESLPARALPPSLLPLEVFLRHIESLSSATLTPTNTDSQVRNAAFSRYPPREMGKMHGGWS